MQWILALEESQKNSDKKSYFIDYEVCSEVEIPGVLTYADGSLICRLLSEKDKDGLYSYTVRIKFVQKDNLNNDQYSQNGYSFPGGLIGELIAIFSVYFQARFFLKSCTNYFDNLPFRIGFSSRYLFPNRNAYFEMFSDQKRNWGRDGLRFFMDTIKSVDQKYHQKLAYAFYWYAEGIKEIGVNHNLFYIRMVSSIEALLDNEIESPQDSLERKLDSLINEDYFDNPEKQQIQQWIRTRKIKKRFVSFVEKYSKGFFKGGNRKAKHCYIKKSDLENYIKLIYDARSAYLHAGKPMRISPDGNADFARSWDSGSLNNKILPRVRWFERIVNHCLKGFVDDRQTKTSKSV